MVNATGKQWYVLLQWICAQISICCFLINSCSPTVKEVLGQKTVPSVAKRHSSFAVSELEIIINEYTFRGVYAVMNEIITSS